jgi:hypothetical protein
MKNFQHVFTIMMENTGFNTLIGNSNAPFISAAASNYGLATNYFGVTHPSQPNYIAATSGSTNGVMTIATLPSMSLTSSIYAARCINLNSTRNASSRDPYRRVPYRPHRVAKARLDFLSSGSFQGLAWRNRVSPFAPFPYRMLGL